jgi:chromosome segregation ATPase
VRQLSLKVKEAKKLSVAEVKLATEKHTAEVAKLDREKEGLRLHVHRQQIDYKDRVASLEGKRAALELRCSGSELESHKLWRELQGQEAKGRKWQSTAVSLEDRVVEKEIERNKLCNNIEMANKTIGAASTEIERVRLELGAKCKELDKLTHRFSTWKQAEEKRARALKAKIAALITDRDDLLEVCCFHNVVCIMFIVILSHYISAGLKGGKTNNDHDGKEIREIGPC